MEDIAIIDLYFDRSEQAIVETDSKYGGYCYSISDFVSARSLYVFGHFLFFRVLCIDAQIHQTGRGDPSGKFHILTSMSSKHSSFSDGCFFI